jgi:DNA helicase II / ATP-dependent DNA helicase PcrA
VIKESQLNEPQRAAVQHQEGPAVVFAGAGSGKTRVITERIHRLIDSGVAGYNILAITFTNKAAKEMAARALALNPDVRFATISTFHAFGAKILREFAGHLGFGSDFSIFDESESKSAARTTIKYIWPDAKDALDDLASLREMLHDFKINGVTPKQASVKGFSELVKIPTGGIEFYRAYQEYLANCNAMDFGDLILNTLHLLRSFADVKKILQDRYKFILVDEFQDTNRSQLELINHLCEEHRNLFVVGDDDQSIYSWRGAVPGNILSFEQQYPGAKRYLLEQNYRSNKVIVGAANAMIAHNKHRAPKNLFSEVEAKEKIGFHVLDDNHREAWHAVHLILSNLQNYHYSDFAVFYRTNAQSRMIEDALRQEQIPYDIYGALRFYDRAEIKDIIAYLKLTVNEDDDVSFLRVVNTPPRGIGQKSMEWMMAFAQSKSLSLMKALRLAIADRLKEAQKFIDFVRIIDTVGTRNTNFTTLVEDFVLAVKYEEYLEKRFPMYLHEKLDNLTELATAMNDSGCETLSAWLEIVSLNPEKEEKSEPGVSLMTLHSSKGLEFKRVVILGVEDGLLPHQSSMDDPDQLEEERRLFYVGMTRAMDRLDLLCASQRTMYDRTQANTASRFLYEIPQQFFETYVLEDVSQSQSNTQGQITSGVHVFHDAYGSGVVEGIENRFGKNKATVRFHDFGRRVVAVHHLKKK